ncbi:MAG: hypothetical protein HP048_05635, partial [Clostridia bacterium]|nr:hypothetical protein [Clostridia bacterium]
NTASVKRRDPAQTKYSDQGVPVIMKMSGIRNPFKSTGGSAARKIFYVFL